MTDRTEGHRRIPCLLCRPYFEVLQQGRPRSEQERRRAAGRRRSMDRGYPPSRRGFSALYRLSVEVQDAATAVETPGTSNRQPQRRSDA